MSSDHKRPQKAIASTAKEKMDHKNNLKKWKTEQKKQALEKNLQQNTFEQTQKKKKL